jgi:hypothetical protein
MEFPLAVGVMGIDGQPGHNDGNTAVVGQQPRGRATLVLLTLYRRAHRYSDTQQTGNGAPVAHGYFNWFTGSAV